ncbi:L-threonylcarbamoyladenylate synthase [Chitinispirillales bacterium ANBcel5]|uniref:L-threonylcarbamoyladenylate synthase n=1 Tax=Cellulosispirillum alkaliphilum TaxID=3039283 RepID=UPI002A5506A0|nr:L-threonylcarbamoyladenylate synthase [Chitinispirillales bacterium ANBcel5]
MVIYNVHSKNPQRRFIESAVKILRDQNGVAVYPTDTVYGMGAAITNPKAINKLVQLIQKDKKRLFSFICGDFSQISDYVRLSNAHYRLLKRYLPGPYTFILNATNLVPKKIIPKRNTVGIRIPDCKTTMDLVNTLGEPLANTSINVPGSLRAIPDEIQKIISHEVDVMLDTGPLNDPRNSTIVDLTGEDPVVVREGKGEWLD